MPKISVLLPVYNTKEEHLIECIESILNQTFKDFELIILNDGSTNNVEEIIKQYSDERIKYFKNEVNEGITKARNKLLNMANGDYIAIVDHDDISFPERFEKEYNFLESHPDISIVSGWLEIFPKYSLCKTKEFPKYIDMLQRPELLHPACMWRKKDFEKYNLIYEEDYFGVQDYALFAKAIRNLKFANLQEPMIKYREHSSNASLQKQKMATETDRVRKEMLEFLTSDQNTKKILYNRLMFPKVGFVRSIFSITNYGAKKIIRILGFKIVLNRFSK